MHWCPCLCRRQDVIPMTIILFYFFIRLGRVGMGGRRKSPSRFGRIDVPVGFTQLLHMQVGCERCPILDHVCPLDNQSVLRAACGSSCPRYWWPLLCWSFCSMASTSVQVNKDGLYFPEMHFGLRIYLSTFVWKLKGKLFVKMSKWWLSVFLSVQINVSCHLFWHLTESQAKFSVSKEHIRRCLCQGEFNLTG